MSWWHAFLVVMWILGWLSLGVIVAEFINFGMSEKKFPKEQHPSFFRDYK